MALGLLIISHQFQEFIPTAAHPWCDIHSISINVCGVWEDKGRGSSLQEKVLHTYTLKLSYSRILSCIKKKKKSLFREEDVSFPTHLGHLNLS